MDTLVFMLACVAVQASSIKTLNSRKTVVSDESTKIGIYDGSKTSIKDHPSLAVLNVERDFFCQCTIVSQQHVVTTGDCVSGLTPPKASIIVGSEDGQKGSKFQVDKIIPHPQYGEQIFDYDYAIIKIKGKFKWSDKVKAVSLPKKPAAVGTDMVVAGWGSTSSVDSDDEPNRTLLQGTMAWLDKKKCKQIYEEFGITWTDRMGCAYNKGKTTLCTDDWADAFINKDVLYGMFLTGGTSGWCSSEALPVLASDIATVADWIRKTTGSKYEDE